MPGAAFILRHSYWEKMRPEKPLCAPLAQKASQGIEICLLLDALGSVRISKPFLSPLTAAGGQVAFFMPMLHLPFRGRANLRNHRKMLICDNQTAIIGGMNLASEYMGPQDATNRWRDLSLLVKGPVTDHITDIFRSDWKFANKAPLVCHADIGQNIKSDPGGVTQLVASRTGCSQRFSSQCDPDCDFQGEPAHMDCDAVFCAGRIDVGSPMHRNRTQR